MFLGYNTNGFAHHRLGDAISVLADLGYRGIALTPDVNHFDLLADDWHAVGTWIGQGLAARKLRVVVETGARFILDPLRKHQPTLISPTLGERQARRHFLERAINIAAAWHADCVSFWSGALIDTAPRTDGMNRLVAECQRLADHAADRNVRLAFEPEPGMFIDTMEMFAELHHRVNHPAFGLTIDIGHLVCNGELPVSRFLTDWKHVLWNIHIEDMRRGVHDHVMFGEGDVDFADVFAGLRQAGYNHGVYVELSRHSHDAVTTARKSRDFLSRHLST